MRSIYCVVPNTHGAMIVDAENCPGPGNMFLVKVQGHYDPERIRKILPVEIAPNQLEETLREGVKITGEQLLDFLHMDERLRRHLYDRK